MGERDRGFLGGFPGPGRAGRGEADGALPPLPAPPPLCLGDPRLLLVAESNK